MSEGVRWRRLGTSFWRESWCVTASFFNHRAHQQTWSENARQWFISCSCGAKWVADKK